MHYGYNVSGSQLNGYCPFHDDFSHGHKSFGINLDNGLWNCFSYCGGGNIFTFLRRAGYTSTEIDHLLPEDEQRKLQRFLPEKARAYDKSRLQELPDSLLAAFSFVPDPLVAAGFDRDLLKEFEVGYDTHNYRLTFPLRDQRGRLVGIAGRTLIPEEEAVCKYQIYTGKELQVPEYTECKKSHLLYNMYRINPEVLEGLIVVEGYKACIWVHGLLRRLDMPSWGVVATSTASTSYTQAELLSTLDVPIYYMYDNDKGGNRGTIRSVREVSKSNTVRVCDLDIVRRLQPDQLEAEELLLVLEQAKSWVTQTLIFDKRYGGKTWHANYQAGIPVI